MRYGDTVDVVVRGGKASHEGVVTCGSVWSCPTCSAAVCAHRASELTGGLSRAREMGWHAYLVTLTVPHGLRDDLRPLFALVAKAWQRMLAGKAWKSAKKSIGFEGYVRALETTWGSRHGFHPHVHVIVLTRYQLPEQLTARELARMPEAMLARVRALRSEADDGRLADWRRGADEIPVGPSRPEDRDELDRAALAARCQVAPQSAEGLRLWLWRRWARIVRRLGLKDAPTLSNGVRVDVSNNAARYLTKMGLAREITVPAAKKGRARNLTHWQLLHRCNNGGGSRYDRALWQEWVEGTKGRKQLTWSKGLRRKLGLGEEVEDEAIAHDAAELERRLAIAGKTFDARLRWRPHKLRDLEIAVASADTQTIAGILGPPDGWSYSEPTDDIILGGQEGRVERGSGAPVDDSWIANVTFDAITGEVYDDERRARRLAWLHRRDVASSG